MTDIGNVCQSLTFLAKVRHSVAEDPLNVSLTPELVAYVEARVASGSFRSRSEVVRHALRTLGMREPLPGPSHGSPVPSDVSPGPPAAGGASTVPGGPGRPDPDPALDAKIRELVEPARAVRDRIRKVVFGQRCTDPRILVRRLRSSSDLLPGPSEHAPGSDLTADLLVRSIGAPLLGGLQEMEFEIQARLGLHMFVEFEHVWLERGHPDDVVVVLPL